MNGEGKILYENIFDISRKLIYERTNTYDTKNLLIRTQLFDAGIDVFGNYHDTFEGDQTDFTYNNQARLISSKEYVQGKVFIILYYKYR